MTLPILLGISVALVAYQAFRRPVLRRLAFRDAVRRPSETALVIAGSLLGTALITGSFIVGDTLDSSIKATAYTQLGPVDEMVTVPQPRVARDLERDLRAASAPEIDGVLSLRVAESAFVSKASGRKKAEPGGQLLEMDFSEGRAFGADPDITGISGDTPEPGSAVITEDLAGRIGATSGDPFTAFLYGRALELRVDRVVATEGLAGFWLGFGSTSPNAFVAPGTLDDVIAKRLPPGATPPVTALLVSNRGGVEDSARLTDEVTPIIEEAFPSAGALRVEEVKQDRLDNAAEQGDAFSEIFVGIGSFAIIAGILLLVNIFVMLAEERKSQLGMLRAVGMRRSYLVRSFVIEGAMYALASSLLGAALGIGVGWAIVKVAAPIFGAFGDFSLALRFDFEGDSIVSGFCMGALISLATVLLTSFRISRINIIQAIRDLPEQHSYRPRRRTIIGGSILFVVVTGAFVATFDQEEAWMLAILGPPVALIALLPAMSRLVSRRPAVLVVAVLSLVWGIFGDAILGGDFFGSGEIFSFVLQGVLLTFSAVMLLTHVQETLEDGIRKVAARRLPLRLGVAYPLARRFRTGLTLGMFALVVFTMTFIATLSNVFGGQVESTTAKEGDFEILMTANATNAPSADQVMKVEGVESVAPMLSGVALFAVEGEPEPAPWPASGVDETFIEGGPPNLNEIDERFENDRAAWAALVREPGNMIVPAFFLQEGGGPGAELVEPGDVVSVLDPATGASVERTIVGLVENDFAFSGAYMSKASMKEVLGPRAAAARFYVEGPESPEEADRVAEALQARFVSNGVEADPFRRIVEDFQQTNLQFFRLMQGYLALGLIVGIAGLGVVMVRAVRERRRDVGVLRSLGFLVQQVRRAFVIESGFVALEGILIGAVLALVTASQLVASGEFGENVAFVIPWFDLSILTVGSLAGSLLATIWPAQQASQIPPAAALRIAD